MITSPTAQPIVYDHEKAYIEGDWYPRPLPDNIHLAPMAYPDTSYSFTSFFSKQPNAFSLGYGSGNYGHGVFTTGEHGVITIGDYVVLQCTRLVCNLRIDIGDHCMFSWGSTITDTWVRSDQQTIEQRKRWLDDAARRSNRHIEIDQPQPVVIEENVWVGFEAVIMPGVRIGRGAIIGSKSIITEDVPPYAVVVGNPGKIIRYLPPSDQDEAHLQRMMQQKKNCSAS